MEEDIQYLEDTHMEIILGKKSPEKIASRRKLEEDETPNVDLLALSGFEELVPFLAQTLSNLSDEE